MIFIKSSLIDFYNCFEIPVRVLDKDMNIISDVGYSPFYDYIFKDLPLKENLTSSSLKNKSSFLITFENNMVFYSLFNYKEINKNIFFIIGPLYLKEELKLAKDPLEIYKIPLKTKKCLKYYKTFLKIILEEKIKESSSTNYSPYVHRAIKFIEDNYYKNISVSNLCLEFKINKPYFCNLFKKETGQTFVNFLNSYRIKRSKKLLKNLDFSMLDIAHRVGFNNQSYYCTTFKKFTGISPLKYREENLKIT